MLGFKDILKDKHKKEQHKSKVKKQETDRLRKNDNIAMQEPTILTPILTRKKKKSIERVLAKPQGNYTTNIKEQGTWKIHLIKSCIDEQEEGGLRFGMMINGAMRLLLCILFFLFFFLHLKAAIFVPGLLSQFMKLAPPDKNRLKYVYSIVCTVMWQGHGRTGFYLDWSVLVGRKNFICLSDFRIYLL